MLSQWSCSNLAFIKRKQSELISILSNFLVILNIFEYSEEVEHLEGEIFRGFEEKKHGSIRSKRETERDTERMEWN